MASAAGGSWRMRVDYQKFNQVVTHIAAIVPDVVSLHEQINTSPGTWYAAIDLANAFFSVLALRIISSNLLSVDKASSRPLQFNVKDIFILLPCAITHLEGI